MLPRPPADFVSNGPIRRSSGLHAHLHSEQSGLAAGYVDFRPASQPHVQLPANTKLHFLNEVDIDDLLAIGTKKPLRIEPLLQAVQRPSKQRTLLAPEQANIISFRHQHADFAQRHEPATIAIAYEQSFEDVM